MVQNLKKVLKSKISKFLSFLRHEVPFKANNNREAVVVCARHVVKRPSKRSVLVYIYTIKTRLKYTSTLRLLKLNTMCILMLQIGWPPQISDMLTHHRINTSS